MENAFNYSLGSESRMQGGDGRYNRLAQAQLFKEANPDIELEVKTKRVTDKVSETLNVIANEPSLAFFRIQEHVRKCLPQLVETKHEVQDLQQKIQGSSFDTEYQTNAVKDMQKSSAHFENIQDLLKNAIFMKQQIDYEKSRREQEKLHPSMYSTKSSPSINAPGDRPGRLSRTHSTSSDRSSRRSRDKQLLMGATSRPHSSCGVIAADQGREGPSGSRSRAGVRDLALSARKHPDERSLRETQPHGSTRHSSEIKTGNASKTQLEGVVPLATKGSVPDILKKDTGADKCEVKPKKELPGVDKRREKCHKGKDPVMKTKSGDSTGVKGHNVDKYGHNRKLSLGKGDGLSKVSSSTKDSKPCHQQKDISSHAKDHKERKTEGHSEHFFRRDTSKMAERSKGDNQSHTGQLIKRKSSKELASDKSKGEHQNKPATSGVSKSSSSRKDGHKKEEKHQKTDVDKHGSGSISKSGGDGRRMVEGKHSGQE